MNMTRNIILFPAASLLLMTGCASTAGYKKPISDFQNASSVVTQSAGIYVTQLNKTQRDAYIDQQVSNNEQIKLTEIEKLQVFTPEGIETRLTALKELASYGELLAQLANSDAPERITDNAKDLAESLDKLGGHVNELSGGGDAGFKGAFGPASLIMSEVARFSVEKKMQKALDKAVLDGEKPITNLLHAIKTDLAMAYELKRNAVTNTRVIYIDGYDEEHQKGNKANLDVLRQRGDKIKSALDAWEGLPTSNPSEGLDAMVVAHRALVDYAKSSKKPADLKELADQMEIFGERAKRVGSAVRQLQHLNNNN